MRYLLASICGVIVLSSPVKAAVLDAWQFDANQNKLSFTTEGGVQPEAQLITNPTRLVIKLPGTTLGKVEVSRLINGPIKAVNLFQLDGGVAQIIIVLADGYTIDPAQVLFKGISTTEWMVQLPTPILTAVNSPPVVTPPPAPPAPPPPAPPAPPPAPAPRPNITTPSNPRQNSVNPRSINTNGKSATLVEEIRLKDNGIVLKTSGKLAEYDLKQGDRGWLTLDIFNATLVAKNLKSSEKYNENGLSITQISQLSSNPPVVRVNIILPDNQPWVANSHPDGIILWEEGKKPPAKEQHNGFVTIDQIALKDGTELIVSGNQPINYTDGWDTETGAYGITLFNARIKEGLELPKRQVGGSLIWVKLRQEDPETVTLLIKPATGVQIGEVAAVSNKLLSLAMGWGQSGNLPGNQGQTLPSLPQTNNTNQNRASNNRRQPANIRNWPPRNNPQPNNNNNTNNNPIALPPLPARDGRTLVVIDPGHGGPTDLGAVGIGGLVEKEIVLEISLQVAQLLQQQGIQIVMTRQDDRDLDLPPRSEIANRINADLFVSIHANAISMSRPDVNGVETFYYDSGQALAQDIQSSILQAFPMTDRGARQARFHVLRNTKMPAVLVEVGFVTGSYDALILANPQQRTRMAQAIARGILRYVSNNFPARR